MTLGSEFQNGAFVVGISAVCIGIALALWPYGISIALGIIVLAFATIGPYMAPKSPESPPDV